MDNTKLVVVLFVIVLLFAFVVAAVLYWYKQQQPQQEVMGSDDKVARNLDGSQTRDREGDKPLLTTDNNVNGSSFYDEGGVESSSPRTPHSGAFPAGGAAIGARGSKKMDPHGSVASLRDSRSFRDPKKGMVTMPPKRRSPPIGSPDPGASPLSSSMCQSPGGGNPLANKDRL